MYKLPAFLDLSFQKVYEVIFLELNTLLSKNIEDEMVN